MEQLPCNPYFDPTSIALKCSIKGPILPNNTYITIAWFRRLDREIAGMGKELEPAAESNLDLIDIKTDSVRISNEFIVSSVLRITVSDVEPDNLTGMYWCAVKAGLETPIGDRQYVSLRSDTTLFLPEEAYSGNVRCSDAYATESSLDACVAFEALPDFLALMSSSVNLATSGEGSEGDPILDTTTIAILSAVGVALFVVIHVLLVIVTCLCMKRRRKRREMPGMSKVKYF